MIKGVRCILAIMFLQVLYAQTSEENYCITRGGKVVSMVFQIGTSNGTEEGRIQRFCHLLSSGGNLGIVGLDTFGSTTKTIAATYSKKLVLNPNIPIQGSSQQFAVNLCRNLGGSTSNFFYNGGFADQLGQAGICFFGDGSAIASWTLFYIGIGSRNDIKNKIRSTPFNIPVPYPYSLSTNQGGNVGSKQIV
jgi:hypothetical protein